MERRIWVIPTAADSCSEHRRLLRGTLPCHPSSPPPPTHSDKSKELCLIWFRGDATKCKYVSMQQMRERGRDRCRSDGPR
jgi:hypothetical protein